jgi:hypothetical protein
MNSRYLRTAVLGAIGVGLALSQQACANDAVATTAAPTTTAPATTAPATAATATAAPSTTTSERPARASVPAEGGSATVPGCLNNDVEVEVTFQPQATTGKNRSGLVAVTNTSGDTCQVRGHFAMLLVNAANELVDVPRELVDEPGRAVTVTLEPGRSAFAGIKWTACDKAADDCGVGVGMRYNLQSSTDGKFAELTGFPPGEASALTMSSLKIGTLQPSRQGVVAW